MRDPGNEVGWYVDKVLIFDPNFSFCEDCLHLDVYSPNDSASLPMFTFMVDLSSSELP